MKVLNKLIPALICSFLIVSHAAAAFPEKPIQLVLGFKAGGALDTMARIVADELTDALGQPVVVQNKAGGGGNLATTYVKRAKADGYTISLIPMQSLIYAPVALKAKYAVDDFSFLGSGVTMQEAFVSLSNKPYKTFLEMIDWAKKNNKKLRYASVVPIDVALTKAISKETGVIILPVPTKGGAASMTSVLGGHVDFGFSGGIHYQYVKAGKMNILMGLGSEKLAAFPKVPTIVESGWDIPMENHYVLFLRKETPKDIQQKLAQAAEKAFKSDKFKEIVEKTKLAENYLPPVAVEEEVVKAQEVVKKF